MANLFLSLFQARVPKEGKKMSPVVPCFFFASSVDSPLTLRLLHERRRHPTIVPQSGLVTINFSNSQMANDPLCGPVNSKDCPMLKTKADVSRHLSTVQTCRACYAHGPATKLFPLALSFTGGTGGEASQPNLPPLLAVPIVYTPHVARMPQLCCHRRTLPCDDRSH